MVYILKTLSQIVGNVPLSKNFVAAITARSNLKLYQNLVNIASARLVSQLHSGEENNDRFVILLHKLELLNKNYRPRHMVYN